MKLKSQRPSIAAARRFIQAKGWHIDGKEVVIPAQTEDGPRVRLTLVQFCRDYAGKIADFDTHRKQQHKAAFKIRQARQLAGIK